MMHPPAPSGAPAVEHGKVWQRSGSAKAGGAAGRRQSWHTADAADGAGGAAAAAPLPLAKVIQPDGAGWKGGRVEGCMVHGGGLGLVRGMLWYAACRMQRAAVVPVRLGLRSARH
jgi:hypothetical protein